MQHTLNLDDELVATARELTGEGETDALIETALMALIQRESARRLARAGGAYRGLQTVRRRRGAAV